MEAGKSEQVEPGSEPTHSPSRDSWAVPRAPSRDGSCNFILELLLIDQCRKGVWFSFSDQREHKNWSGKTKVSWH